MKSVGIYELGMENVLQEEQGLLQKRKTNPFLVCIGRRLHWFGSVNKGPSGANAAFQIKQMRGFLSP